MLTLSPTSENFNSENDTPNNMDMIPCDRFGWCAQLQGNMTSTLGTAEAENLDGPHFTSSIWLKVDDLSATLDFSVGTKGWSLLDGGKLKLTGAESPSANVITAGTWHYICWVKGENSQALYIDGAVADKNTDTYPVTFSYHVSFKTTKAVSVQLAHQHNYSRSLTIPEMLVDQSAYFPPARQSFSEYYPLDVNIVNIAGKWEHYPENKLFIVDRSVSGIEKIKQQLSIKNITQKTIVFKNKSKASEQEYHFELRLRNAIFSEPDTYPAIANNAYFVYRKPEQNPEDGSWSIYISISGNLSLAPGETIDFDYEYVSADGSLGERSTHQLLRYKDLAYQGGGSIEGERDKRVDILNLPSSIVYPLYADYTSIHGILANATNTLDIYVYNRSEAEVCFSTTGNITIKIPYGSSASDFADTHNENGIANKASIGNDQSASGEFSVSRLPGGEKSIFTWKPQGVVIPASSFVKFQITNLTANDKIGTVFIDVEINGIDNHGDTILPLAIKKGDCNLANLVGDNSVGIFTNKPSKAFHVKGDTCIEGELTINDRIGWNRSSTTAGKLTVNCKSDLKDDLEVSGQSDLKGGLKVTGTTSTDKLEATGSIKSGGTISDNAGIVMPKGGIIMWSGSLGDIPDGWLLCDGENGTPDLFGRFVIGAKYEYGPYGVGMDGGESRVILRADNLPKHTHDYIDKNYRENTDLTHGDRTQATGEGDDSGAVFTDTKTTEFNETAVEGFDIIPPYYALAYLMKQ